MMMRSPQIITPHISIKIKDKGFCMHIANPSNKPKKETITHLKPKTTHERTR